MRILVGIEACESYVHRLSACRRWMPALQAAGVDCLLVFGGGDRREGDRLWLPVSPLGAPHLVQRTTHLARYASAAGYDYLFKCDDDAAIHPARFAGYDLRGRDYVGIEPFAGWGYAQGGAGYWLSRRAMQVVAAIEVELGHEDLETGRALQAAGIPLDLEPRICHKTWRPDWLALHQSPGPPVQRPKLPCRIAGGKLAAISGPMFHQSSPPRATPRPEADQAACQAICRTNECGAFDSANDACRLCGCHSERHDKWRSKLRFGNCPRGFWTNFTKELG